MRFQLSTCVGCVADSDWPSRASLLFLIPVDIAPQQIVTVLAVRDRTVGGGGGGGGTSFVLEKTSTKLGSESGSDIG